MRWKLLLLSLSLHALTFASLHADEAEKAFKDRIVPLLERRCLACHNESERKGGLSLVSRTDAMKGGSSGEVIVPGKPDDSYLIELITSHDGKAEMPKDAAALSADDVAIVRRWIAAGAAWPEGIALTEPRVTDLSWWSLQPLVRPALPELNAQEKEWSRTAVDAFIAAEHRKRKLAPSPEADRRTLIRRLYFDLIGLPPSPEDVERFLADADPQAYEKAVDRLLASSHYGERWGRHWLDVVHYGDTHGYDKDKLRPNAWPYRDYVIRAFNEDKPYDRFIEEQIAGDVLRPGSVDGIVATGFLAAGPWDFIGHAEVPETKIDGKIARHLDRDDMVVTVMNSFTSMTVQCAQCHNHKFDPITQEHYYNLQSVFAAIDRADRAYDPDPAVAKQRVELAARVSELEKTLAATNEEVLRRAGPELATIETRLKALTQQKSNQTTGAAYGYHSALETSADKAKWVQIDLGEAIDIGRITYVGCWDAFNQIFHGFGFPSRYRIEVSNDPEFRDGVTCAVDFTAIDVPNPGTTPQSATLEKTSARYVRFTATKLGLRMNDYMFALGELGVYDAAGRNVALGKKVSSLDSIEAPVRWTRQNLVDGYYYGVGDNPDAINEIADLQKQRTTLLATKLDADLRRRNDETSVQLASAKADLGRLPPQKTVYCGTVYSGNGSFRGTGPLGIPRPIHVLARGDVRKPGKTAVPGSVPVIPGIDATFNLPAEHTEGMRRAALAQWITRTDNPLTWRSIVNRMWLYHFGRGLVDSPNDFGRMGRLPSHPELLDWLAVEFRDGGRSFKKLHKLIVVSAVYRQTSTGDEVKERVDGDNQYVWRMNRRKLEAEAVRDAVLVVAGKLDVRAGGPGYRDFVIEKPEHSPHYEYQLYDPEDPQSHRRSVYRFIVRSQPQPFMNTLDCADPALLVDKRNETLTALQALALLNNKFMLSMSKHFAARLEKEAASPAKQIDLAMRLAVAREPLPEERERLIAYAEQYGTANLCRVILNLNEFVFVD